MQYVDQVRLGSPAWPRFRTWCEHVLASSNRRSAIPPCAAPRWRAGEGDGGRSRVGIAGEITSSGSGGCDADTGSGSPSDEDPLAGFVDSSADVGRRDLTPTNTLLHGPLTGPPPYARARGSRCCERRAGGRGSLTHISHYAFRAFERSLNPKPEIGDEAKDGYEDTVQLAVTKRGTQNPRGLGWFIRSYRLR